MRRGEFEGGAGAGRSEKIEGEDRGQRTEDRGERREQIRRGDIEGSEESPMEE